MSIKFDFETESIKRPSSLKEIITPEQLKKNGIVTFAAGEMDFKCAPVINDAIIKLASNGYYGFTLKDKAYEDAIIYWYKKTRNIDINRDDIVTTLGTIHSLANCIKLFCKKKDDAIIVLAPYYSRYKQAADRLNRRTVVSNLIEKDNTYYFDFKDIEEKFKDNHNKILVLNNPLNPSGTIFSKSDIQKLCDLSNKYGVIVFSDEIFGEISLNNEYIPSYYSCINDSYGIVCTSLGKTFSMTGLNHANVFIKDKALREKFIKQRTNDHYGSIDPLAYEATLAGYTNDGYLWLKKMCNLVNKNSKLVHKTIEEHFPELRVFNNEGSFVCWIDFSAWHKKSEELHEYLIDKAMLDLDIGDNYGDDYSSYARMSLGSTYKQTKLAMQRLIKIKDGKDK